MTIMEKITGSDELKPNPKLNTDMQEVLDALAALGGKSAEKFAASGLKKAFGTDTFL